MKKCCIEGCDTKNYARGFCFKHYQKMRREGKLPPVQLRAEGLPCKVEDCEEPVRCKELCSSHYNYLRRTGKTHKETSDESLLCTVDGCTREWRGRGLCTMHYNRFRRTGSTERRNMKAGGDCAIPGCERETRSKGLCSKHYARQQRGTLTDEVIQNGDAVIKPLADKLEDLEELVHFGVTDLEELWTRAGFTNEQQMMHQSPKELKERIKLYASSGI